MQGSKTVLRCEDRIRPSQQQDSSSYMNSFNMQKSRRFMPKSRDAGLAPGEFLKPDDLVQDAIECLKEQPHLNDKRSKYFKCITTKPIMSSRPVKLLEESYPLGEDEYLNVCETKTFEIRNYYNYLYDEEVEKSRFKKEERNRQIEALMRMNREESPRKLKPDDTIYETVVKNQEERILDPEHSKYLQPFNTFHVKEKDRKQSEVDLVRDVFNESQVDHYIMGSQFQKKGSNKGVGIFNRNSMDMDEKFGGGQPKQGGWDTGLDRQHSGIQGSNAERGGWNNGERGGWNNQQQGSNLGYSGERGSNIGYSGQRGGNIFFSGEGSGNQGSMNRIDEYGGGGYRNSGGYGGGNSGGYGMHESQNADSEDY